MLNTPKELDPERDFADPDQKEVAAAVTVTAQVSNTRSIVVQTYIARDSALSDYHEVLDKVTAAVNRQEAKLQIEEHELNLATEEKTLRQLKEDFLEIEPRAQRLWENGRKKGPWPGLTAQETAAKQTAMTNVKRYEEAIAKRKADISKLKAIAEG